MTGLSTGTRGGGGGRSVDTVTCNRTGHVHFALITRAVCPDSRETIKPSDGRATEFPCSAGPFLAAADRTLNQREKTGENTRGASLPRFADTLERDRRSR